MSLKLLTKEAVQEKRELLTKDGKPPSIRTLRSALGCGSMSTLVKILREIDGDHDQPSVSDPDALTHFNAVWSAAKAAGRDERTQEIAHLKDALDALTAETEQLEGELEATRARVGELTEQRDGLFNDITESQKCLTATRAAAEENARKTLAAIEQISVMRENHAREVALLTEKLRIAQADQQEITARFTSQINDATIALARAEATLASASAQAANENALRVAATDKLAATEAELAQVRVKAEAAMERVSAVQKDGIERLAAQQAQHTAEIATFIQSIRSSEPGKSRSINRTNKKTD